jgi:pimeloyl-ACP methyl ester carboxylesterase
MDDGYDELGLLEENAADAGLRWIGPPAVVRRSVDVGGRAVSALVWGTRPAEVVFLHGGAQNAHTWDTVALALGRPMVAVDLPGHGHSDWREDHDYDVLGQADDVAQLVRELAPEASTIVGIGIGSPVGLLAADRLGDSIRRLVMIDSVAGASVPGAADRHMEAAANVAAFTTQHDFASFEEMVERAVRFNPDRNERALRRGVLHNARAQDDGSWGWRWDPDQRAGGDYAFDASDAALDRFAGPILLVRGERSDIVIDERVSVFQDRHPDSELVTIEGAGHAVQGDRPVELAHVLEAFLDR